MKYNYSKPKTDILLKTALSLLFMYGFSFNTSAQNQISGQLKAHDSITFSIINVLPDSFPAISIIFKGQKSDGEPLWNLKKEDFSVLENGRPSNVKSLTPISANKAINIGIVIDHSGSMQVDNSLLYNKNGRALYSFDPNTLAPILPKGYISPIDNGKITSKDFANSFNFRKDFISVIGFSSTVDRILPLTNNKEKIDSVINSMQADSLTALYDAMLMGLNQLDAAKGVNVLVTLTDGQNNKSKSKWTEVTEKAIALDIPIYIIGLGNVNKDTLQMIADQTKGQFIYTKTSKSFKEIYSRISKEIQSFYDLRYESENLSAMETKRNLTITFSPNSNQLDTLKYDFELPVEVVDYLKSRAMRMNYMVGTSAVSAVSLFAFVIVYRRRRKKKQSLKAGNGTPVERNS